MGGERVAEVRVDHRGIVDDRRWAVVGNDGKIGSGRTTRRFRRMLGLLSLRADTDGEGTVWVTLPGDKRRRVSDPVTASIPLRGCRTPRT